MKSKIFILMIIICVTGTLVYAGDESRIGTSSGIQLLIPVGAQSMALGGAVVSNVVGAEAIFYNPGGMSLAPKSEILVSNMQYIADIDVNYVAAVFNGGRIGAFGLSVKSISFGKIEETTEQFPEGTGNTYSPSFIVAGISYARYLTDRISAGLTAKYVYESIMQTGASTVAFDFGVQYAFNNNLRLGVAMNNVGGKLQYVGRNLERPFQIPGSNTGSDDGNFEGIALASDVPSFFSFGVSYVVNINEENHFDLIGNFTNQNDASDVFAGGVQFAFRELFFLRGGYNMTTANQDDNIFGYSAGVGIKYPIGNFDFYFDYAYRQLTDYFDANNVFTVKIGL
jgi:hypothetical protein